MISSDETLVLADVVSSLGCIFAKLLRNEELSSVSCLICARILARIYGTFKYVKNAVDRPARLPLCVRCFDKSFYNASMSLSDFPFV